MTAESPCEGLPGARCGDPVRPASSARKRPRTGHASSTCAFGRQSDLPGVARVASPRGTTRRSDAEETTTMTTARVILTSAPTPRRCRAPARCSSRGALRGRGNAADHMRGVYDPGGRVASPAEAMVTAHGRRSRARAARRRRERIGRRCDPHRRRHLRRAWRDHRAVEIAPRGAGSAAPRAVRAVGSRCSPAATPRR